jgi:hypothetical protein
MDRNKRAIIIIIIIMCPERLWDPIRLLLKASLWYRNLGVDGTKHAVTGILYPEGSGTEALRPCGYLAWG